VVPVAPPSLDRIVETLRAMPKWEPTAETIPTIRKLLDSMGAPLPKGTATQSVVADGSRAEWVLADEIDPARRMLYVHGGGFVAGSPTSHRALAARIGRAAGCAVLLADYPLAPEHPFPAALEDCVRCLRFLRDRGPEGSTPAREVIVAGDSAGGGLALATLLACRDAGEPMPAASVTLSAWTDLTMSGPSVVAQAAADPMIQAAHMGPCAALYLGTHSARDPLASPLFGDLRGLPPLLMQVGDREVMLDDTRRFAARAREHGVRVTEEVWPGMFHVFQAFAGVLAEGMQAIDRIGHWIDAQCGAPAMRG